MTWRILSGGKEHAALSDVGIDPEWFDDWLKEQYSRHDVITKISFQLERNDGTLEDVVLVGEEDAISSARFLLNVYVPSSTDNRPSNTIHAVPQWGEIVLLFVLPRSAREALPGCLAEEFTTVIVPKMGLQLARLWYWAQVLRALPWVRIVAIYEFLRWKIGR